MSCCSPDYCFAVGRAYDIMLALGANGCCVLPEGLVARLDDAQLEKLKNKLVMWVQRESKLQKKQLREEGQLKTDLDTVLDDIIAGVKSLSGVEQEMRAAGKFDRLCNKVWNYWMQRKRVISAEELDAGLERCLGKFRSEVERRFAGENDQRFAEGKDIKFGCWIFSAHTIERARERVEKLAEKSCRDVTRWLAQDLSDAKEAVCKKRYLAAQLLNHHFESAKYLLSRHELLYVIVDSNYVKTVHLNESKRFKKI